jgi:outer membrane lipoprotein-sorting protein
VIGLPYIPVAVVALAGVQASGIDADLLKRLEAADAKAASVVDLIADFEQKKHTALLKEPMVSSGRLRVRGSTVRWDTSMPRASVLWMDEREIRVYYPLDASLEIYPVDEPLRRLTASPIPRLKPMQEQFDITAMPLSEIEGAAESTSLFAIRLTPKGEALRKHVKEVRVLVDSGTGLTSRMEVVDPEGDRTLIAFTNTRANTGLAEKDLELKVPEGTKVSRPLDGLAPGGAGGPGK